MYIKWEQLTAKYATHVDRRWNKLTEEGGIVQPPILKPGNDYSLVGWLNE